MTFRCTVAIPFRWGDVDSQGVVNHAVYLTLLEQARYEYFGRLGLLRQGNIPFVLAASSLQWRRPGRLGMQPEVGARVTRLGRTSFAMEYQVTAGGELLVEATATLVYVDAALRPEPIPERDRAAISAFEGLQAG